MSNEEAMQIPGGEITNTGGGCVGIMVRTHSGGHVLLTRPNTEGEPPLVGDTHVDVGVYNSDSWSMEFHESMPVADVLSRLPEWTAK